MAPLPTRQVWGIFGVFVTALYETVLKSRFVRICFTRQRVSLVVTLYISYGRNQPVLCTVFVAYLPGLRQRSRSWMLQLCRYQDGGATANNPAALALAEARALWPDTPVDVLVSLGR